MHEGTESGKALAILSEVATVLTAADWLDGAGYEPPGPGAGSHGLLRFESAEGGMRRAWIVPAEAPGIEGDEHTATSLRGLAATRVLGVEKRAASWTLLDGRACEPDEVRIRLGVAGRAQSALWIVCRPNVDGSLEVREMVRMTDDGRLLEFRPDRLVGERGGAGDRLDKRAAFRPSSRQGVVLS